MSRMASTRLTLALASLLLCQSAAAQNTPSAPGVPGVPSAPSVLGVLVLQTDFGLRDHAVAEMRGVARLVAPNLAIDDLTHEIPAYDVWQAAYRLSAVMPYWPADTVFVSVIDPGVGSARESVAARLAGGQVVVTAQQRHIDAAA